MQNVELSLRADHVKEQAAAIAEWLRQNGITARLAYIASPGSSLRARVGFEGGDDADRFRRYAATQAWNVSGEIRVGDLSSPEAGEATLASSGGKTKRSLSSPRRRQ
jgi:hypothetical protein